MSIHPTAIIASSAELGADVKVGPWCIVEDGAKVGAGSVLHARSHVCRGATIGQNCNIHMNAVIGYMPQDFSYKGEPIHTILGDNVTIRENATIHGSVGETGTLVGDNCYLMVGTHVAHNCKLGKGVLMANGAMLAGYVEVGENAVISGNVVIHQFVRIGRLAILSGGSRIGMDVPPYLIGDGANAVTILNAVGLRRAKFLTDDDRREIKSAYKVIYRSDLDFKDALARVKTQFQSPAVKHWVEFFEAPSRRGLCRFRAGGRRGTQSGAGEE